MAKVKVTFSSVMMRVTGGEKTVELEAGTLRELFANLVSRYGDDFKERVLEPTGEPRRFVNIYVNGRDMRFLQGFDSKLKDGDEVTVLPAVSGGRHQ